MAREMTAAEEQYLMHAVGHDPLIAAYLNNQVAHGRNFLQTAANLPVCSYCEHAALYHEGGVICSTCGKISPGKGHRVAQHLKAGMYR